MLHLHEIYPRNGAEKLAGRVKYAAVPADVADFPAGGHVGDDLLDNEGRERADNIDLASKLFLG
jgi:hypothetical protein